MTIEGTAGSDVLTGTSRRDVIHARGGDDRVTDIDKGDRVCAGGGNDVVVAMHRGYPSAYLDLGSGDDRARTTSGEVQGGAGDDTLVLFGRVGLVRPGTGDDDVRMMHPGRNADNNICVVYRSAQRRVAVDLRSGRARGQGQDRLRGVRCIEGSRHDDVFVGTAASEIFDVGSGHNRVNAGAGGDSIYSGWLKGGGIFTLGPGHDNAELGAGSDVVYGGPGRDSIQGLQGPDRLFGGLGDDRLNGTHYCDTASSVGTGMFDASGNEVYGGPGDDEVTGDRGNDIIIGGPGLDRGYPGPPRSPGVDVFESVERLTGCR